MSVDESWHLDKRLNLSHLLTTLTIVITAMVYMSNQDKKIGVLAQRVDTHDVQIADLKKDLNERLNRIESKLDRAIEGMNKR